MLGLSASNLIVVSLSHPDPHGRLKSGYTIASLEPVSAGVASSLPAGLGAAPFAALVRSMAGGDGIVNRFRDGDTGAMAHRAESGRSRFRRARWWAPIILLVVVAAVGALAGGNRSSPKGFGTTSSTAAPSSGGPVTTTTDEDDLGGPGAPTVDGTVLPAAAVRATGAAACRSGPPLANVYHPNRLTVVKACATVSGTVESVRSEPDGDTHFDVAVDPPFDDLLTAANLSGQHGWLVAEIVPADEPGCTPGRPPRPPEGTYDYGVCTGANELAPVRGQHVWVSGPYVLDEDHGGWAEIHPVWSVSVTEPTAGASPPPPPGASPTAGPPSTAGGPSGVRIVSVSSPVPRGSEASLVARAAPQAACDLEVTLPSGSPSQSQGLGAGRADSTGQVQWSWRTGSRTEPGTATATVTCGSASAETTFQITS